MFIVFQENLAGGGDHLAFQALLAVQVAQRPEHAVNLASGEAGAGGHTELTLHVVLGVEENAAGFLLVATGPAGLLEVVFQRARDIGVNHQPHVGFVDAHCRRRWWRR